MKKEKFKQHYLEMRKKILSTINTNIDFFVDTDGDDVDQIQGQTLTSIAQQLGEREFEKLKKIDIALTKLEKGGFGKCEYCDGLISEKRLMALPGVDNCIECAEEIEREAKQYVFG